MPVIRNILLNRNWMQHRFTVGLCLKVTESFFVFTCVVLNKKEKTRCNCTMSIYLIYQIQIIKSIE